MPQARDKQRLSQSTSDARHLFVQAKIGARRRERNGSPFHGSADRSSSLGVLPGLAGSASAGDHDLADAERGQVVGDGGFAVAAVRGFRPVRLITRSTACLSRGASGGLPGCTSWSSTIRSWLSRPRLVPEIDRLAQPALPDRAGVRVMQTDPPSHTIGCGPGQPLPGLLDNPAGRHRPARPGR
jgi:hypothetical protein